MRYCSRLEEAESWQNILSCAPRKTASQLMKKPASSITKKRTDKKGKKEKHSLTASVICGRIFLSPKQEKRICRIRRRKEREQRGKTYNGNILM